MAERDLERVLLVQPEHVQYLTGFRTPHPLLKTAVALDADGHCTLAAPNSAPDNVAADAVVTFEAQWHATLRQEQPRESSRVLAAALDGRPPAKRLGVEFSTFGPHFRDATGPAASSQTTDIEPDLWQLRRNKDPDELAMIGRAIECTEAMYRRAREIIQPGITELEVFNQLHAAAVDVAGEPLTALGNDYQANSPGGPPRPRQAGAGELFVLDLGPAYRGYYADNCRTISVDGQPTDEQLKAWQAIVDTLDMVERTVRPGVSCQKLFHSAQNMLDEYRPGAFSHHLGHAFGLFPHEGPHLNPNWDDTFEEGDVFTAEPGLYGPELQAGIRLEQNYRVTVDGVQRLTSHPLELAVN
jgi:Xaa-Pro aminopeptidase